VEQLFLHAGPPIASFELSTGGSIYTWSSGTDIRFREGPPTNIAPPNAPPIFAVTNIPDVRECRARIVTDAAGRIIELTIEEGSQVWLCTDAFRLPAPGA
jgi:hypothetical protein